MLNTMEQEMDLVSDIIVIDGVVGAIRSYGLHFKKLGDCSVYEHMEQTCRILIEQRDLLRDSLEKLKKIKFNHEEIEKSEIVTRLVIVR